MVSTELPPISYQHHQVTMMTAETTARIVTMMAAEVTARIVTAAVATEVPTTVTAAMAATATAAAALAPRSVRYWRQRQRNTHCQYGFSVLPDLTDQDLKDIGVSLGHRRQLPSFRSFLVIPFFGPPLRARNSPTPKGAIGRSTPAEKSQPASLYAGHIR
jgi:hypothetical protein